MKYLSILRYALLIVSVAVVAIPFITMTGDQPSVDAMLNFAGILLGITTVASIILPAFNLAQNPKGAVRSLLGFAIVAVIFGIAYSMSDGTPVVTPAETYDNVLELRLSDTGLFATYFAMAIAIGSILVLEVYNMFK